MKSGLSYLVDANQTKVSYLSRYKSIASADNWNVEDEKEVYRARKSHERLSLPKIVWSTDLFDLLSDTQYKSLSIYFGLSDLFVLFGWGRVTDIIWLVNLLQC